jgi:adenosylhomocysteinase
VIPARQSTINPMVVDELINNDISVCTTGNYVEKAIVRRPEIIIDDGAQLIDSIHKYYPEYADQVIVACEQTETGVLKIEKLAKPLFPVVLVNNSPLKLLMDSGYGTGESAIYSFLKATHVTVAGKKVVVVGYGNVGSKVAKRFQGMGAQIIVVEIDPIKYLDALMSGMAVMTMEEASHVGDIFTTQTGQANVINDKHFRNMKTGSFLCNFGHENVEINVPELEAWSTSSKKISPDGENYYITAYKKGDKTLYLLGGGNVLNLSIAYGNSPVMLDCSFSLQLFSSIKYSMERLEPGIYDVDSEITNYLAKEKLALLGYL